MFSKKLICLKEEVLQEIAPQFAAIDKRAEENTLKVLQAMQEEKISAAHFSVSNGYAYDDIGRDKLDKVFARVFGAEKALVRQQFVSGTHALAAVLFGILRPGDELLSVTGEPYDTLQKVIGAQGKSAGSLAEFGVHYAEVPLKDGEVDYAGIARAITAKTKIAMVQRSRGYNSRRSLLTEDIEKIVAVVKKANPACIVFVDNCYGEFVQTCEPTQVGADICAGSLIKNPGGGIAPTGGYAVGRADLIDLVSYRLTAPGIGGEVGASLSSNRLFFEGLFLSPHTVAQALKSAIFAAGLFDKLSYNVSPTVNEQRGDIIQIVELKTPEKVTAFARGLQRYSPVDSFASPTAWDMPGYDDRVIMAAGTFVQGASIEISADAPMREPYNVYLQGGLVFEHSILAIMGAAEEII